mmetsp:Transcript_32054/g.98978  ORF Transcript_32054/g.98978 Transcript_32054/m.98978 type:complete len:317 (-) Transcript_32054:130-1080(-)
MRVATRSWSKFQRGRPGERRRVASATASWRRDAAAPRLRRGYSEGSVPHAGYFDPSKNLKEIADWMRKSKMSFCNVEHAARVPSAADVRTTRNDVRVLARPPRRDTVRRGDDSRRKRGASAAPPRRKRGADAEDARRRRGDLTDPSRRRGDFADPSRRRRGDDGNPSRRGAADRAPSSVGRVRGRPGHAARPLEHRRRRNNKRPLGQGPGRAQRLDRRLRGGRGEPEARAARGSSGRVGAAARAARVPAHVEQPLPRHAAGGGHRPGLPPAVAGPEPRRRRAAALGRGERAGRRARRVGAAGSGVGCVTSSYCGPG